MNSVTVTSNPFDFLMAFAFFCGPAGALLFGNSVPPARQKELVVALGQGSLVILLGLFIAAGLDLPTHAGSSMLAVPFGLLFASAPKIIGASLFILGGYFINKLLTGAGRTTTVGLHLGLVAASVFMVLNFPHL